MSFTFSNYSKDFVLELTGKFIKVSWLEFSMIIEHKIDLNMLLPLRYLTNCKFFWQGSVFIVWYEVWIYLIHHLVFNSHWWFSFAWSKLSDSFSKSSLKVSICTHVQSHINCEHKHIILKVPSNLNNYFRIVGNFWHWHTIAISDGS